MTFARPTEPVLLRSTMVAWRVGFLLRYDYVIDSAKGSGYDVLAIGYRYHVLDLEGREIVAYHWHPTGVSPVTYPHVHLSRRLAPIPVGRGGEPVALADMHLPSGVVTFADVVRLLITEFEVVPRRADWAAVLERDGDG